MGDTFSTGSTKARRYPLSYILSGYYTWLYDELRNQAVYGVYWSSTAGSSTNAYYLRIDNSGLSPQTNDTRFGGESLRYTLGNNHNCVFIILGKYIMLLLDFGK